MKCAFTINEKIMLIAKKHKKIENTLSLFQEFRANIYKNSDSIVKSKNIFQNLGKIRYIYRKKKEIVNSVIMKLKQIACSIK